MVLGLFILPQNLNLWFSLAVKLTNGTLAQTSEQYRSF